METTPLLTIPEAQDRLRLSRAAIYKLIGAGHLTRVKLGPRSARITEQSLEAFIARSAA